MNHKERLKEIVETSSSQKREIINYLFDHISEEDLEKLYSKIFKFDEKTITKSNNFIEAFIKKGKEEKYSFYCEEIPTGQYSGFWGENYEYLEHDFTKIAPCDIMDEFGEFEIPIKDGFHLDKDFVGEHLNRYDSILVLSHFKGHTMAGFHGALKNISIGIASTH